MQRFETFERVCEFFIMSKLDKNYVKRIDQSLENSSSDKTNKNILFLIKQIKSFHNMRKTLCLTIFKCLDNHSILNELAESSSVVQYRFCPEKSTCTVSNKVLKQKQGILLIIDGKKPFSIHSRYKILLYHFFILTHFPDEIGLESLKWLKKQTWWKRGEQISFEECARRILNYNDHAFAKSLYVKLKATAEYIEIESKKFCV